MKHRNLLGILFGGLLGCTGCHSTDTAIRTVKAPEFSQLIEDKASIQLVDVRTPEEFQAGHIPGALLIDVKSAQRHPAGNGSAAASHLMSQDGAAPSLGKQEEGA